MRFRYPVVLFDLDHTLFDFETSKKISFQSVAASVGHGHRADELRGVLSEVEAPLWKQLEAGELTLKQLAPERFRRLVEAASIDADPEELAQDYLDGLGVSGGLLPGAREVLDALKPTHTMGLITNGDGGVQRTRLHKFDLGKYFDAVAISGELGVAKPDPAFFDQVFDQLPAVDRSDVLVVGDSLTSDMAGGIASGLATCWFNPDNKPAPADVELDHVVTDLAEVVEIVS